MSDPVCFHCRHPESEHVYDPEKGVVECKRIMSLEAGRPYYCRCRRLNTDKRREKGEWDDKNR
jgi:hypothetical protein